MSEEGKHWVQMSILRGAEIMTKRIDTSDAMEKLSRLSQAVRLRNEAEQEIAQVIGRPGLIGHVGEYIASHIFGIALQESAAHKAIDGVFASGPLQGRTVNIEWYAKLESVLDVSPAAELDYYLVMTGPEAPGASSRGVTRPWLISYVFLFDARVLVAALRERGVQIGVATSVAKRLWEAAQIYPVQRNSDLVVSVEQRHLLGLFG